MPGRRPVAVSSGADVAYRHVHTLRCLAGCIRAVGFHCSVSRVLKQQSQSVVKMGYYHFQIKLSIYLVETKPVLWDKTDDIFKDKNETKKTRIKCYICLQEYIYTVLLYLKTEISQLLQF
jgi:hypothetical protein